LHIGFFWSAVGFMLVTPAAGGYYIFPTVCTGSGDWLYMVSGQLVGVKLSRTIHADMTVSGK
jgi:hypothetical protein